MKIRKILIANRGEIAVRIIRAARTLGMHAVQAHSSADADSLAVRLADEAVEIGPPPAGKSYLNGQAIIEAALQSGAQAIHPGYGFLAENADFADAVVAAGLIFIGPDGNTIRKMGDKASARQAAADAGVPTVPGSDGVLTDLGRAVDIAHQIGFPVMIKATAGGGGRGIRIAHTAEEFAQLAPQAATEAEAAFGDGGLYLEKLIARSRHIEVQILGDGTRFVHCHERECSLQRRRQKVWEEAPATSLSDETRAELCDAAVALAASVGYRGAGTVEFLYDEASGEFYFIEMNTRIQVEHPVTEAILGVDLVAEMIRIADGEPLSLTQNDLKPQGHAIEIRLNAEDPANNFMPFPGQLGEMNIPAGPGIRFDHMLYPGYLVPPFYDSLLGKLIVHAPDRSQALARLKAALAELQLEGLKTTAPLAAALADDPDVRSGAVHTNWLEPWLNSHAHTLSQQKDDLP